jgi:hypothetical protein
MANTVTNPTHVRWALEQVLALQPDHVQARQMLARLDQQVASTAAHSAGRPQPSAATTAGASMSTGSTTIGKVPPATMDMLRGILAGALVAALSGALWFGADVLLYSLIGERETVSIKVILIPFLLAGVLGGWTAQSVIWGARRGGLIMAISSALLLLVALFISDYFLDRHYMIQAMAESGMSIDSVPLLLPLDRMIDLVQIGLESSPIYAVYYGIALLVAFITPLTPGGRRVRR